MTDMKERINELADSINSKALLARSLTDWRPILAVECQVYVYNENYIAKRFDQINYKFCNKVEAKEILIDNLYALLRFKYFPKQNEDIDERISEIVKDFTLNLKTSLKKVSYDLDTDCNLIKMIPDGCVAFRNGVFDFKKNDWLFKYDIINIEKLSNKMYLYDPTYTILWYMNYNFEPLDMLNINDISLEEFVNLLKELDKTEKNYCFELMYNIAHDVEDNFKLDRFQHLCEIMGYLLVQSFCQKFVILIGSGGNGKNSLFDGCFTSKVVPTPSAISLDDIEEDDFVTGALSGKSHNIFLETSPKVHTESKMLKELTGSMYQTINEKGVPKYSSIINCKYLWSGNDQDKIKFADITEGFRRRNNIFEIWYHWDDKKRFLTKGDYYDTTFSESLQEIKSDLSNYYMFIYFGMMGVRLATNNWVSPFKFTYNDWKLQYSDVDFDLKERIEQLRPDILGLTLKKYASKNKDYAYMLYDENKTLLSKSKTIKDLGYNDIDGLIEMLNDEEISSMYFAEHDIYLSLKCLQVLVGDRNPTTSFNSSIKKLYNITKGFDRLYNNNPYIKCTFIGSKLKVVN